MSAIAATSERRPASRGQRRAARRVRRATGPRSRADQRRSPPAAPATVTVTSSSDVARIDDAVAEVLHHAEQAERGGARPRAPARRTCPSSAPTSSADEERDERQRRRHQLVARQRRRQQTDRQRRRRRAAPCRDSRPRSAPDRAPRPPRAGRRGRAASAPRPSRRTPAPPATCPSTTSAGVTGAVSSGSMVPLRSSSATRRIGSTVASSAERDPVQHRAAEEELHHAARAARRAGPGTARTSRTRPPAAPGTAPAPPSPPACGSTPPTRGARSPRSHASSDVASDVASRRRPCANSLVAATPPCRLSRSAAGVPVRRSPRPRSQDDDPARQRLDVGQDVRRQQHRPLARQLADQRVRLADLVRIEADGRLVEDQDRRARQQRVRQPDPLPVAARQRADDLRAPLAQAGDRRSRRRPPRAARRARSP